MRNRLLAAAALASTLSAACRRAPPAAPAPDVPALAAPAPASALTTSPLSAQSTSYTNEMQAENLRGQAEKLGIKGFRLPSGGREEEPRPFITQDEGVERTREFAAEFAAKRRDMDHDKDPTVALPGKTPGDLSSKEEGAPIAAP